MIDRRDFTSPDVARLGSGGVTVLVAGGYLSACLDIAASQPAGDDDALVADLVARQSVAHPAPRPARIGCHARCA